MIQSALLIALTLVPGQVVLRGGEAAPEGTVVAVDASGVALGPAPAEGQRPAPTLLIGWDRIKTVEGPQAEAAAKFLAVADQAWRARTRLERGDFVAAEPLFERLFESYRGQTGPTAAVVAEGLLRCRIHRAAHVAAVEPWLAMLKAGASGPVQSLHPAWASEAGMAGVLDPQTGLVPALPPIWLAWPSVDAYARGAGSTTAKQEDARAEALAAVYAQAARFEAGLPAAMPAVGSADAGVQIAAQIVQSRIGDPGQREEARAALRERIKPPTSASVQPAPAWLEAWCRAAIGRSLLREPSPEVRRVGVVELLHVPARFGRAHPYLAGMALAECSMALRQMGDRAGADVLARELVRSYPRHPVSDWPPIRPYLPKPESILTPPPAPTAAQPASPPEEPPQIKP